MSENIIVAIIGIIGTLVVTKFDDIVNLFRKPARDIKGVWDGKTFPVIDGKIQEKATSEYSVELKQNGEKISGTMTQSKVSKDTPSVFKWSGKILNEYFMYDSLPSADTKFFISSGLLHIHPAGEKMSGYIVANSQPDESQRTRIRFTELTRRR
jgi:hypothetical protein